MQISISNTTFLHFLCFIGLMTYVQIAKTLNYQDLCTRNYGVKHSFWNAVLNSSSVKKSSSLKCYD